MRRSALATPFRSAPIALALLAACGGGGGDSPTAPVPAHVTAAVDPNPITARVCSCGPLVGELDFEAHLVLTESAGSGAALEQYRLVLRADAGNREVGNALFPAEGNRQVPPSGTLRYSFAYHFPGANSALPGTLEITASIVDAAGNRSDVTTSVRVLPPPG